MILNSQNLFDPTKFERRNGTSYKESIRDLKEQLPTFLKIFYDAFDMTIDELSKKPLSYRNRNSESNRMNENLQGRFLDEYGINQIKFEKHKVFYLDWIGKYKIYFKKLNNKFIPSYKQTFASDKRLHQRELFNNDSNPILYVGYHVDDMWSTLKGVYLVCIDNGKLQWREPLNELRVDMPLTENNKKKTSDIILVRPKKNRKKAL